VLPLLLCIVLIKAHRLCCKHCIVIPTDDRSAANLFKTFIRNVSRDVLEEEVELTDLPLWRRWYSIGNRCERSPRQLARRRAILAIEHTVNLRSDGSSAAAAAAAVPLYNRSPTDATVAQTDFQGLFELSTRFAMYAVQGLRKCRASVSLSVCPSISSSGLCTPLRRVCCCGPGGQEISIDCCTAGAQQQTASRVTLSADVGSWTCILVVNLLWT